MNTRIPRLEAEELLYRVPLLTLGRPAFDRKRAHHGDQVAYAASAREVLYVTGSTTPGPANPLWKRIEKPELRALHLVGAGWHRWGWGPFTAFLRAVRAARHDVWVTALTPVDVAAFGRARHMSCRKVLATLHGAGLDELDDAGMPPPLMAKPAPHEDPAGLAPAAWQAVQAQAHEAGLATRAVLHYGGPETGTMLLDQLFALRDLEDQAPGCHSVTLRPAAARLAPAWTLRVTAVTRLLLDNIARVQTPWPHHHMTGETAMACLAFGADTLDTTAAKVTEAHRGLPRMIRQAGQTPAESGQTLFLTTRPASAHAAAG
ncbi:MAG: hypothetical protein ACLFTT_12925 [Candidatus Hydrogenedentota bacterium]